VIQLTIAWTCVGIFIATAIITLLALVGVLKLADKKYLDRLVKVLIVEVSAACIAAFTGVLELPRTVEKRVEAVGQEKAWKTIEPKLETLNQEIAAREVKVQEYLRQIPQERIAPADRPILEKPVRFDPKVVRMMRER
jgi:hypothetical protein